VTDPLARARSYISRTTGLSDEARTRRALNRLQARLADSARETPDTTPLNWSQIEQVDALPEPDASMAGRLVILRRDNATDMLYVAAVREDGVAIWAAVSEINDVQAEFLAFRWANGSLTETAYGVDTTATEILYASTSTVFPYTPAAPLATVYRRDFANGSYLGMIGSYGTGSGQFQQPRGVAVSGAGNIHVSDAALNRVVQFNSSRTFVRNIGSSGSGNGQLSSPDGVACDSSNNVYVADTGNKRVVVFSSTGTFQRNIGSGQLTTPVGVAVTSTGDLHVSDSTRNVVRVYTASTGAFLREYGGFGTGSQQLTTPAHISVDSNDNVYIVDRGNNRIVKYDVAGTLVAVFDGNANTTAKTYDPYGAAVNGSDLYVVTYGSSGRGQVRKFGILERGANEISRNGTLQATRNHLNFVGGTGITMTVADDSANGRANITTTFAPTITQRSPATATTIAAGGTANPTANCLTGEIAIAGGWNANTTLIRVYNSYQNTSTQWLISVLNQDSVSRTVTPYVICIATG